MRNLLISCLAVLITPGEQLSFYLWLAVQLDVSTDSLSSEYTEIPLFTRQSTKYCNDHRSYCLILYLGELKRLTIILVCKVVAQYYILNKVICVSHESKLEELSLKRTIMSGLLGYKRFNVLTSRVTQSSFAAHTCFTRKDATRICDINSPISAPKATAIVLVMVKYQDHSILCRLCDSGSFWKQGSVAFWIHLE